MSRKDNYFYALNRLISLMINEMKNEGIIERFLQSAISASLFFSVVFVFVGMWQIMFFILAIVIGAFAIIGFCPLYRLLGINTNKK